jgi:hypothetical protein
MSIPTRVVNALNLGRAMAARVDTGDPGWTAWLFIRGVIARDQTWDALRETWALSGTAARVYEPPRAFVIRYTRLSEAHLEAERRDDLDLAMRANPPEDWVVIAPDLESTERVLRRFCPDLERIRFPAEVDYPEPPPRFAELRRLEDVLGPA